MDKTKELAEMLQNSNVPEVKELAEGYLKLEITFLELKEDFIRYTSREVIKKHYNLLKKLGND